MLFALIVVPVLGLFLGVHRYLWCRLVRDTTKPGGRLRRAGTAAAFVLPLTALAALLSGRAGAPFPVQQALAWPGYLWLAMVLYLTLALLAGEVVRALGLRALRHHEPTEPDPRPPLPRPLPPHLLPHPHRPPLPPSSRPAHPPCRRPRPRPVGSSSPGRSPPAPPWPPRPPSDTAPRRPCAARW